MSFTNLIPLSEKDASLMNVLQLAYIGDAVWTLIVRNDLLRKGLKVHHMHSECIRLVNAHAQASFIPLLAPDLTPVENDLLRRGRNAHTHHPVPKNQNPEDYAMATAFEVLVGYLFLIGNEDRLAFFTERIIGGINNG